ncbi:MAG TPA: 4-hydroxy-3-methylbut-2-enyl diphosphate reductase [Sphaerochaeta sp.]|nr:4-hydroxy-3-methylbut-2-enyl diphosphate reductase [Sphaerochaeta sp.]HOR79718.1 4-hydroxy-3-methylbut-2-enyl diphosphate reductase [Sphaerochaeta sp.]HPK63715.1 4-hydroxy-3-methylbut-2-enyl diphosphate reductase [Sphaerochaeta sp.]
MKIVLAKTMGYCGGVSRALDLTEEAIAYATEHALPVYSLGKLIHNPQVIASLAERGMSIIEHPEGYEPGVLVVRAHGISDTLRKEFVDAGFLLFDATCPVVRHNLSNIAHWAKTRPILIIGHKGHPEVLAMQGVHVGGKPIKSFLITNAEETSSLIDRPYAVFVQTTFDQVLLEEIRGSLEAFHHVVYVNEICPSSISRRMAALDLALQCDAALVIGGKQSANTKALAELVSNEGKKAYHIEDSTEIPVEAFSYGTLGILAGASTPSSVIEEVVQTLQRSKT